MTTETPPPAGAGTGTKTSTATGTALALLVALVITAPACLLAVYLAPQSARLGVAWAGGATAVVVCAAVGTAAHQRLTARRLRRTIADRDIEAAAHRAAVVHFAEFTVPAVIERLHGGASADAALAAVPPVQDETLRAVLGTFAAEVHRSETRCAAAMAACGNAAGRVQALTTSMAADLRDMEHRHADPDVLGDLLHLDHRTAQAGRLADSIAVLTGARSGRRWAKPIVMESILRGAMGRIGGYQRVRLHSTSTAAVAGHAAEGVMHALAELMDNAANFSPPTAEVHVYVEEVASGVVITVEDGGLVMGEVALRRAERAVSGEDQDLGALSGTRLGLAVVGRLARKHGLSVSFRPSAHGGTGVLLRIPQDLITDPHRAPGPRSAVGGVQQPAESAAPPAAVPVDDDAPEPEPVPQYGPEAGPGRTPALSDRPDADADADATAAAGEQEPAAPDTDGPHGGGAPPVTVPKPRTAEADGTQADGAGTHHADTPTPTPAPSRRWGTDDEPQHGTAHGAPAAAQPHDPPGGRRSGAEDGSAVRPAPEGAPGSDRTGTAGTGIAGHPDTVRSPAVEYGESGLPKRRRGRTLAAAQRSAVPPPSAPRARSTAEAASRFGTFRRAVRGDTPPPEESGTPFSGSPASPSSHSSSRSEDDAE